MNIGTPIVLFFIKKGSRIYLIKNEKDGRWTLPGEFIWESCENLGDFARAFLYKYFERLSVHSFELIVSSKEKILFEDRCDKYSIFECRITGRHRRDMKERIWPAKTRSLVPQALTPGMLRILDHPEVRSRLP